MRISNIHPQLSQCFPRATALLLTSVYTIAPTSAIVLIKPQSALSQTSLPLPIAQPTESPLQLIEPAKPQGTLQNPPAPVSGTQPPFHLYRLGAGDTISVVVQRFPDLNFQATIDQEGNVIAPLVGKVSLQGLTIKQAQERVQQGVNRFVIDPIVLLALTNQRPVLVTVTGEIARPGLYPLQTPRTSAALLLAGGATATADLRSIHVKRSMPDGTVLEEKLDLVTPLKTGAALPDLRLQDGDVVVVPKLEAVGDYDQSLVARSTLVKPQITVRFLSYASNGLGNVTLPNGSTFLDALTAAKPSPDNANFRRIALIRFDPVQKKAVSRDIDARKILAGDMSQNVMLQDNDVIVVGRNLVGKITYALNTFTQPFRDVLGFLLFFKELQNSATNLFGPTGR